jgi:hydrogenase nickel incorporation protein HypB
MCATCGCDPGLEADQHRRAPAQDPDDHDGPRGHAHPHDHAHGAAHDHPHDHDHDHDHPHGAHDHGHGHVHDDRPTEARRTVSLQSDVLAKNDARAAANRAWLNQRDVAAFNFTSAPGSGKTSLLEALIKRLAGRIRLAVIEGDQETERDAQRIRAAGAPAIQINTGTGCHLDAQMVKSVMADLDPPRGSLLLIENVGNLVCPALFDLGERAKVVVLSVTEGEDKPLKYPHMFRAAEVVVLNKIDLLPYVDFDVEAFLANLRRVNPSPRARVFQLSARDGTGVAALCDWLASQVATAAGPT